MPAIINIAEQVPQTSRILPMPPPNDDDRRSAVSSFMPVTSPEKRTEHYYKVRPCIKFVRTAAEILDKYIEENPPKNKV